MSEGEKEESRDVASCAYMGSVSAPRRSGEYRDELYPTDVYCKCGEVSHGVGAPSAMEAHVQHRLADVQRSLGISMHTTIVAQQAADHVTRALLTVMHDTRGRLDAASTRDEAYEVMTIMFSDLARALESTGDSETLDR